MKRSRSSYEAQSPQLRDHPALCPAISAVQQHLVSNGQQSIFSEYLDDALDSTQYLDTPQRFFGSNVEGDDVQANTSNQYDHASTSIDFQRKPTQPQRSPPQHSEARQRGIVSYAESPGPIGVGHEARSTSQYIPGAAPSPYNIRRGSYSAASQRSAFTTMADPPATTTQTTAVCATPYGSYRGLFNDPDTAKAHRHISTRFGRQPYIFPEDDDTIEPVERNRQANVGRIYNAMICGDRAQDNPGSIAMKRWVTGAHYKSDLVEAFAHKIFDCLLVQVKEGFRGWHHNDYVDDDRKGEREDREADCEHRLENIIDALEREKTVCEDVVNSASQIRMFVNAPIAYAQRKVQNRQGNSKRGRAKGTSDPNPYLTTRRRTGGRQMNRSTATPDRPISRHTTPQFQTPVPTELPYYSTEISQPAQFSPTSSCFAPRQPLQNSAVLSPPVPTGYCQATATALPTTAQLYTLPTATSMAALSFPLASDSRAYNAHGTKMPTAQMLPTQMSPLPSKQPGTYHSAPPPPEDAVYGTASSPNDCPTVDTVNTFDTSLYKPVEPSLSPEDPFLAPEAWSNEAWSNEPCSAQALEGTNRLDHQQITTHASLADIETTTVEPFQRHVDDAVNPLVSYWNNIEGVQPFFFN